MTSFPSNRKELCHLIDNYLIVLIEIEEVGGEAKQIPAS